MKKPVVLLFVLVLIAGVIGAAAAQDGVVPLEPAPACNGLCKALSRLDESDPAFAEIYVKCKENNCLKFCDTQDEPGCEGLCTALAAVDPASNAHDVLYHLACRNDRSCDCCKPPADMHKYLLASVGKYDDSYNKLRVGCEKGDQVACLKILTYLQDVEELAQLQHDYLAYMSSR